MVCAGTTPAMHTLAATSSAPCARRQSDGRMTRAHDGGDARDRDCLISHEPRHDRNGREKLNRMRRDEAAMSWAPAKVGPGLAAPPSSLPARLAPAERPTESRYLRS